MTALFGNDGPDHVADGFRGGSNDDPGSDLLKKRNTDPNPESDVTAA